MKKNFGKLSAVCLLLAAAGTGCSSWHNRNADERYDTGSIQRDNQYQRSSRTYQVSPPPDLVASGIADPSGLRSTSAEGARRTTDLISPPPDLVASGVTDQNGLNSGAASSSNSTASRQNASDDMYAPIATGTSATTGTAGTYGSSYNTGAYNSSNKTGTERMSEQRLGQSIVLDFDSSSADLTDLAKSKLRDAVSVVGADNIRRVEVAAWSDKNFPRTGGDLSKPDRDLADKRADNINDFLKHDLDLSFMRIRTYSMAEGSNWLARMFRTDEAELKSVFAKENEAPMAREDFNAIINQGGPSRAVIVLIRKR